MLEGQVEKARLERMEAAIEARGQRGLRGLEREAVVGEGAGRAAEQVARQLVEGEDPREGGARPPAPAVERARGGAVRQVGEASAQLPVDLGAALEPEPAALRHRFRRIEVAAEPEVEQLAVAAHQPCFQPATISSRFALRATSSKRMPSGSSKKVA